MEMCPLVLMGRRQKATIEAVLKVYQHGYVYLVLLSTHLDFGLPFSFIGGGEL